MAIKENILKTTNSEQAQINVLTFPDCVRLRKGMYLSSPDQCIFEMIDNAIDEIDDAIDEIDDAIDELSNTKKIMGEDTYNSLLNTYKTNIAKQNEAKQELLTRKSNHKQMKMEFKRLKNEHML